MLAIKSVSLSCIFRKLSILTCFFLLAGFGESCFPASAQAQQIVEEHLIQAKTDLSSSKKINSVADDHAETIVASENLESEAVEPESVEPDTSVHEAGTEEINSAEIDSESASSEEINGVEDNPEPADSDIEKRIIAELNRVRTNPQAYADWLESQRQHFQGMILTLPGEQSLRTNRGLRALNEAIAFVRNQQPLPALTDNADLFTNAQEQVEAIVNQQKLDHHTNNLVYNRVTPEAIVMQLVVDDGFPDRRHRLAVFQEDYQHTGIVCQEIEIYKQVCAIAYENKPLEIIQDSDVQVASNQSSTAKSTSITNPSDELPKSGSSVNSEIASNSQSSSVPEKIIETKSPETANSSSSLPAPPPAPAEVVTNDNQENASQDTNPQTEVAEKVNSQTPAEPKPESNSESAAESVIAANPATPQEAILPPIPNEETSQEKPTNENESVTASAENTSESSSESSSESTTASTQAELETTATESETTATEPETTATETETTEETKPKTEVVAAANTVKPAQVAEIIESGILEDGDDVVPNDGSFYDSYPLEGSAGDKFSISLESQDFDTFLAVMDPDGNIIEKNDDINEQSSNSRLEITLPDNGSYSVIVNAYDEGGKGKYTLKVTE